MKSTLMREVLDDAMLRQTNALDIHHTAFVGDGVCLGTDVTIGPMSVVLHGDRPNEFTELADGVVIGANATVTAGCKVGLRAVIAPGAVVSRNVPPLAFVEGNPGRISGYVDSKKESDVGPAHRHVSDVSAKTVSSRVTGVKLTELRTIPDMRGTLSPGDFTKDVPFAAKRFFFVYGVPSTETRGEHAHYECKQFLIAVSGSVRVLVDDGINREEFHLNSPSLGVYIPPMVWGVQYRYTSDAVLLVFASEAYQSKDYIRDYAVFLQKVQAPATRKSRDDRVYRSRSDAGSNEIAARGLM